MTSSNLLPFALVLSLFPFPISRGFSQAPCLLCCGSETTISIVQQAFQENTVHCVQSVVQAKEVLSQHPDDTFTAVVVDETTWEEGHLILHCTQRRLLPARIVFSAPHVMLDTEECFTLGADAVCTDSRELVQAHNAIVYHSVTGLECPLKHRLEREQVLRNLAGGALTVRSQQLRSHSNRLEQQLGRMRQHLEAFVQKSFVKVVHISDTHNLHRSLVLPKGDLLLHTGDWSGNYRAPYEINLLEQFRDFLEWIEQTACPDFEQVIILAGNHESYLDPAKQPAQYQEAMEILQSYLDRNPNLAYLDKSSVEYRGLVIYGTPTTICRVETQEKVMLSNGFERTLMERFYDFEQIPECDILLTHLPPAGLGLSLLQDSCPILTKAVYGRQGRKVPRLHAFGHIHSQFGIARESHTILSNACQENLLRVDVFGGGTPIVFDLPIE